MEENDERELNNSLNCSEEYKDVHVKPQEE
jgi:hypothetical protein